MRVGIPRETTEGERRVALVPETVGKLAAGGFELVVEKGAGATASFPDDAYSESGATIGDPWDADAVVKVRKPSAGEREQLRAGQLLIGFLEPLSDPAGVEALAARGVTAFALESVPRITRAQPMDALSSQATVGGYRAALLAAEHLPRFFPMLMTAAGTVPPAKVLAITNTLGSSLAREADGVFYTHAGPEIGVAASKTFATQMVAQELVALYLAQVRAAKFPEEIAEVLADLDELPAKVARAIASEDRVGAVAERLADARDVLFIGRHTGYPAALEGALKLKELSYIHAEAYPAGELKHGPIALIEDGVPVVAIATRCHVYPKMLSNIQEVKARGASVIAIVTEGDTEAARLADHVLEVPETPELLSPVVVTVPLQLLAYHVAVLRGCDVDQPRNLAKSVTVE